MSAAMSSAYSHTVKASGITLSLQPRADGVVGVRAVSPSNSGHVPQASKEPCRCTSLIVRILWLTEMCLKCRDLRHEAKSSAQPSPLLSFIGIRRCSVISSGALRL